MKPLNFFAPVRWVRAAIRATVGEIHYRPPRWLAGTGKAIAAHPRRAFGVVATLAVLGTAGWYGWQWWEAHKPQPTVRVVMRDVEVEIAPPAVASVDAKGKLKMHEVVVRFSESSAPIDQVGKEVAGGVALVPALDGVWQWKDDKTLTFLPDAEWPAGQQFELAFAEGFFPPEVRLDSESLKFATPALNVAFENQSFHTDPKDPTRHEVQATLKSNYTLELDKLKSALSLEVLGDSDLFTYKGVRPTTLLNVVEDEASAGRTYYLRSARIAIPDEEDHVKVSVSGALMAASGGSELGEAVAVKERVPDRMSGFHIARLDSKIVRTADGVPEQVLLVETTGYVAGEALDGKVHCWAVPKEWVRRHKRPGSAEALENVPGGWEPVELVRQEAAGANDEGMSQVHAFTFLREEGATLFVRIDSGVEAMGGFELANAYGTYASLPSFPKEVVILGDGGLLALNGERKLGLKTRGLDYLRTTFARIPEDQINHLVAVTSGDFESPQFKNHWVFNEENIGIYQRKVMPIVSPNDYEASFPLLDMGEAMRTVSAGAEDSRGLFFVTAEGVRPRGDEPGAMEGDGTMTDWLPEYGDSFKKRFVLVTDLGMLVKRASDGSRAVFVQSISNGVPVAGVRVSVVAKNGSEVLAARTDENGYVHLDSVDHLREEKEPTAILAKSGSDVAFIPYQRPDRLIDFSRFDIGGVNASDSEKLEAFVFSERGIYRPGDELHIGAVVRRRDWSGRLQGLPLMLDVRDARGSVVGSSGAPLAADGFVDFSVKLNEASPTGSYTATLYYLVNGQHRQYLGSHRIRVEDFQPDTMKLDVAISGVERANGWIKPEATTARVQLNTLFGFPAADRRVKAKLELSAASFEFDQYADYVFHNRALTAAKNLAGDTVKLGEKKTDENGQAEFDLGMERFENATFRMNVFVEGFEAGGGRSVRGATSTLVAPFDYVVGYKADGALDYVGADSKRVIQLQAVDQSLAPVALHDLAWRVVETRFASVLTKQRNGSYAYVSTKRDKIIADGMMHLEAGGHAFELPTDQVGEMRLELLDVDGNVLLVCPYSVAGKGESGRSLERDAELDVKLADKECNSGDELELSIRAPYAGSGLITIEREGVLAFKWFRMDTTSAVETITVPEGVVGTAYVSVNFVRALDSPEVFMSPLSYAVHPIEVNLDQRRVGVELDVPEVVKPGAELKIGYTAERQGRVILYAVDAGIHQITDYEMPRPLTQLMAKRALEVRTYQLLDLILPEFSLIRNSKAFGGGGAPPKIHLNPFKRRREAPVVFWSGIVDAGPERREVSYQVPDYFSGKLNVMAVMVCDSALGQNEDGVLVRGPMVLTPNVPLFVAPGDEFTASVTVANNLEHEGEDEIAVTLQADERLELVSGPDEPLVLKQGEEGTARFRMKALENLGGAELRFAASASGEEMTRGATLSVRPASPFMTHIQSGYFRLGSHDVDVERELFPQFRKTEASASPLPLGLARGLESYLNVYPHGCSEQITSRAFGRLLLADYPEFGFDRAKTVEAVQGTLSMLSVRQHSNGAFGYWTSRGTGAAADDFLSVYVMSFLVNAKERGYPVPSRMWDLMCSRMREIAAVAPDNMDQAMNQSAAIYYLIRGMHRSSANRLVNLRDTLEQHFTGLWEEDLTAMYVAASYKLLKQDDEAVRLMRRYSEGLAKEKPVDPAYRLDYYHDDEARKALGFALICRHFPEVAKRFGYDDLKPIVKPIEEGRINTLRSSALIQALEAYSAVAGESGAMTAILEKTSGGELNALVPMAPGYSVASFDPTSSQVRFELDKGESKLGAFYQVIEAGFDIGVPDAVVRDGLEVARELVDADGNPVTQLRVGDPVTVRIAVRNISPRVLDYLAVLDLLPGGFEVEANALKPGAGTVPGADFVDVREDRNVFFLGLGKGDLRTFSYRIKPVAAGTFVIPPIFAESMYDPGIKGRSGGGTIEVLPAEEE
ncbi:alpha-2-macroglobulin family protein [Sulfuriroseicoccus oceanibius]|uniref:Alpha-2-macroglobulin family protein n=1 Tax=Sulfuriroseicoccus oceanibius TaxID=2707525 RepID=A0A6B3LAN6_9BACT|nr:alpha-2-macroglobulin [Sulfuriroseicoccus oceanibius]QQL44504.1 alpha-2-macroglobulin family protein [Sulfuriroseicoccus oceanibius]